MAILLFLIILIFSVIVHEVAHGSMALRLGDDTAKRAGRLTLNPIPHIDLFGSILLPFLQYFFANGQIYLAWAKPVPYNPHALYKDYRYGPLKVALVGPLSNLLLALVFGLLARFGIGLLSPIAVGIFGYIALINISLAIFNLIPIPPLDGSSILVALLPQEYAYRVQQIGFGGIIIILLLIQFFGHYLSLARIAVFYLFSGSEVVRATFLTLNAITAGQ